MKYRNKIGKNVFINVKEFVIMLNQYKCLQNICFPKNKLFEYF